MNDHAHHFQALIVADLAGKPDSFAGGIGGHRQLIGDLLALFGVHTAKPHRVSGQVGDREHRNDLDLVFVLAARLLYEFACGV